MISVLRENFVGQYDKAYYKYLPANLEVAKKCLLDCFIFAQFSVLQKIGS